MFDPLRGFICDDCGMIADPCIHEEDGRHLCEGCTEWPETPVEWLQSHLPTDEAAERTMSRHDIKCIRQAIAAIRERDLWMPVLCDIGRIIGDDPECNDEPNYAKIVEDMRDALIAIRAHFDGATETEAVSAQTMREIAHDVLWRNKLPIPVKI